MLRLGAIIDALLRLSRAGWVEYQWQPVNLNRVVGRVIEPFRGTVRERGASVTAHD